MKIVTDNAAYLQKYFLDILINATLVTGEGVPVSMFDVVNKRTFKKYKSKDFIKFTKKEEIEFLKNADWIIDYNAYIDKSVDEIEELINNVDLEGNELNEYYASLSEEKREEEYGLLSIKARMLKYKRESLVDVLNLVKNNKTINLGSSNLILSLFKK